MIRIPTKRPPTHPGEMLLEEFLIPMDINQRELADRLLVSYQEINDIINEKKGIIPSMALRLSKLFGNSPDFWLRMQTCWDLYWAIEKEEEELKKIQTLVTPKIESK